MSGFQTEGYSIASAPWQNKGTSFSVEERQKHGLQGLFPGGSPQTLDQKVELAMLQFHERPRPIDKYIFLHTIQDADETLFYAILVKHTQVVMPFVYTPVVGEACQKWGEIYRHKPRGLYISANDAGSVRSILDNHPQANVKVIVVTDGERILGLGDLGVNGMGIPIGKLALYTACAGIHPDTVLPVHIDVGCDVDSVRDSPFYMGLRQKRDRSQKYDALVAEFFDACQDKYGRNVLIQFEDFGNTNAFRLLEDFQPRACTFNDDIQGTASVCLAGVISSLKLAGKKRVSDHKLLFYGAGEAGVGIADLISLCISHETGCTAEEARKQIYLVDSKGLVCAERGIDTLAHHKQRYAHASPSGTTTSNLLETVRMVKPTGLIGVSAQGQSFTKEVVEEMCKLDAHPLVFALSNPTSKAECTAQQAYEWSNGAAVFTSGSPFDPVILKDGREFVPGQGNNAYIFPGLGLGAVACDATQITDDDLYIAAKALAETVTPERLAVGCAYPPLSEIRDVSLHIASKVAENIMKDGRALGQASPGESIKDMCAKIMYDPTYEAIKAPKRAKL
jgi:malic enzyme